MSSSVELLLDEVAELGHERNSRCSTPASSYESGADVSVNSQDGDAHSLENSINTDSAQTDGYGAGSFEGPEKTMEVVFRPGVGDEDGLRGLSREQLDHLCTLAKCTILSKISSAHIDAYVLSESSLFVYKHRYIMKTCGTTTLLRCLNSLLMFADALGMEVTWVGYSRKNLLFPDAQQFPHSNFGEEIKYISTHAKLQDRLRGSGYILGPITGDHWFVYVADLSPSVAVMPPLLEYEAMPPSVDRTINMMMFDMAPEVGSIFFKKNCETGREMTAKSGIAELCPGATIDETAFSPCGYSMNAILHDAYYTIHITPEPECSYVSFETNTCLRNYHPMVRNVLNVFRPKRFVLTMFGDEAALNSIPELPTDPRSIVLPSFGEYSRTSLSSTKVETELCCLMACYSLNDTMSMGLGKSASSNRLSAQPSGFKVPIRRKERGYSLG